MFSVFWKKGLYQCGKGPSAAGHLFCVPKVLWTLYSISDMLASSQTAFHAKSSASTYIPGPSVFGTSKLFLELFSYACFYGPWSHLQGWTFKKFFLAALGLSCDTWGLCWGVWNLLLWCAGFSLVVACGFSLSSCGAQALGCVGSVVVARGLSCPAACGILVPQTGI